MAPSTLREASPSVSWARRSWKKRVFPRATLEDKRPGTSAQQTRCLPRRRACSPVAPSHTRGFPGDREGYACPGSAQGPPLRQGWEGHSPASPGQPASLPTPLMGPRTDRTHSPAQST